MDCSKKYLHCHCKRIFLNRSKLRDPSNYVQWLNMVCRDVCTRTTCQFARLLVRHFTQRPQVLLQALWLSATQSKWSWINTGGSDLASPRSIVRTPHPVPTTILPIHLNPHSCITIKVMKQSLGVLVAAIQRAYSAHLMPPGTSSEFRKEPINLSVQLRVQQ